MDSSAGPGPESPFLHHQHLLPHIQNYGMFCRLCFFCAAALFENRQTEEHTRLLWKSANFCFTKKHPWLTYFGLFSKNIISLVQVSETTEQTHRLGQG